MLSGDAPPITCAVITQKQQRVGRSLEAWIFCSDVPHKHGIIRQWGHQALYQTESWQRTTEVPDQPPPPQPIQSRVKFISRLSVVLMHFSSTPVHLVGWPSMKLLSINCCQNMKPAVYHTAEGKNSILFLWQLRIFTMHCSTLRLRSLCLGMCI